MEPNSFGRKLGIGIRVASRVVKERVDAHAQKSAQETIKREQAARTAEAQSPAPIQPASRGEGATRQAAETVRRTTETATRTVRKQAPVVAAKARGLGEGARRFGKAMWGPFAHVSSVLWSEVTGLFFGLFAFYFAQGIFRNRAQYKAGPAHEQFVLDVVLTVIFGYFAASSFYIARQKEKKNKRM